MDNSDCRVAHKPHRAPLRWILAVKFHTKRRGTSITRFFNQAQYTLLRASSNREILVGRDGYLFHPSYASTYCKRDITAAAPTLEAWAKMILEIQNGFQKKGKNFLYILTPSKVEYMSDKLPFGYPCPSKERDIFISEALKYLALAGVNYVDASSKMSEIQQRYGYEPFPNRLLKYSPASEPVQRL